MSSGSGAVPVFRRRLPWMRRLVPFLVLAMSGINPHSSTTTHVWILPSAEDVNKAVWIVGMNASPSHGTISSVLIPQTEAQP